MNFTSSSIDFVLKCFSLYLPDHHILLLLFVLGIIWVFSFVRDEDLDDMLRSLLREKFLLLASRLFVWFCTSNASHEGNG